MKIVLIGPVFPFRGGISHYTTALSQALEKENEVLLISFSYQYPKWFFPGKSDQDHSRQPLKPKNAEYLIHSLNPWSWIQTVQRIGQFNPELIIFQWWHWFWTLPFFVMIQLLKLKNKGAILTICHNALFHENDKYFQFASQLILNNSTHIVVHSEQERQRILQLKIKKPLMVHPHPITIHMDPMSMSQQACRAQIGVDFDAKILLFFGFVRPYKGLDILLQSIPEVRKNYPNIMVLIVGEFWKDKHMYLDQIQLLGIEKQVKIIDRYISNEDIYLYFKASDAVVLSYKEVTGSGILPMAIAYERPVIASNVGAFQDLVREGETGILVAPNDADDLARGIDKFFKITDYNYVQKNLSILKLRLSWKSFLDSLMLLIKK